MTDAERDDLCRAYDSLAYLADQECYCDGEDKQVCGIEDPRCDSARARRSQHLIDRVLSPPMESLQPKRLTSPAERVYFETWRKENERQPWLNSGYTTLEWILCPDDQKRPDGVSRRDALVATSVIQWLGTNGGASFMRQCERRIERERAERQGPLAPILNDPLYCTTKERQRPVKQIEMWADMIAGRYSVCSRPDHHKFRDIICEALYLAHEHPPFLEDTPPQAVRAFLFEREC
jgi:hypothetical protein